MSKFILLESVTESPVQGRPFFMTEKVFTSRLKMKKWLASIQRYGTIDLVDININPATQNEIYETGMGFLKYEEKGTIFNYRLRTIESY